MKFTTEPLHPGVFYHIYNRGNNGEDLFIEARNYPYFLALYAKYVEPVAETFAYCLMKNHFHLLVRIKTVDEFLARTSPDQTSQVSKTCEVLNAGGVKLFNPSPRFFQPVQRLRKSD